MILSKNKMEITSFSNPKIKLLRKLQDKKQRHKNGLYYVEGLRILGDALEHAADIDAVFYAPELLRSDFGEQVLKQSREKGIDVYELPAAIFESFAVKEHPQGIAATIKMHDTVLPVVNAETRQIWVGLDAVADPGNLGTILRTQDATAGNGVFMIGNCVDVYDPSVIRGSMGAFFTQPHFASDTAAFERWKKNNNVFVVGTSDRANMDYQQIEYPKQMVLMMGSERQGMHPEIEALCDGVVSIPMSGYMDSLNLSIATSVVLYEIYNQHRKAGWVQEGKK
jgi:RNA methyltransferase, TrmH family